MKLSNLVQIIFFIMVIMGVYLLFTNQVSGRTRLILIVFLLVIGIYLFMKLPLFRSYTNLQMSPVSAKGNEDDGAPFEINGEDLKKTENNYSISQWIYIDDWNYRYGDEKVILVNEYGTEENPKIFLHPYKNDVHFKLVYLGSDSQTNETEEIILNNVNLQKWVHLTMCINDRTVDIYLNGKLVKSKGLKNIVDTSYINSGKIRIVPDGGFGGWISNFRFYNKFLTPQEVWNIYREGYGGSFSGFLDKYNLKLNFYENNVLKNEFLIM